MSTSWRVARSLDVLLAEVNAAAPNRSKLADGSIGDASHQARASDHNPNAAGVVRARYITDDPDDGCDAARLAEHVRRLGLAGHPALGPGAYVIWNWRIASATPDGQPWDWEPYAGSNGHTQHVHISVATSATGYDNTTPWGWPTKEDDDMAQYAEDLKAIKAEVTQTRRLVEEQAQREAQRDRKRMSELRTRLRALRKLGAASAEDLDQLVALTEDDQ